MNSRTPDMDILNDLSEHINLHMKSCWMISHPGDWIEHKAHVYYDLWFIRSGKVLIRFDDEQFVAEEGDIVFFYPDVPYMAYTEREGCRFIFTHFDFVIGERQRILENFELSGIVRHKWIQEDFRLFTQAYDALHPKGANGNRLYMKAQLTAVVARIIELYGQGLYRGDFPVRHRRSKAGRNLDFFQPVFDYVNAHLHTTIRVSELAALVGMSEKYFIDYFRRSIGITPGQYIYQIRMNRARDYLYERRHTIQEIASLLGYPDPFTFSKAFKKYYHVPPSKFV
jgi:AraC-like DNA-binding protein